MVRSLTPLFLMKPKLQQLQPWLPVKTTQILRKKLALMLPSLTLLFFQSSTVFSIITKMSCLFFSTLKRFDWNETDFIFYSSSVMWKHQRSLWHITAATITLLFTYLINEQLLWLQVGVRLAGNVCLKKKKHDWNVCCSFSGFSFSDTERLQNRSKIITKKKTSQNNYNHNPGIKRWKCDEDDSSCVVVAAAGVDRRRGCFS